MKEPIFVIGSSGHARVVIDILERAQEFRIAGLLDDTRAAGQKTDGHAVLGGLAQLPSLARAHGVHAGIVAVGDNWKRAAVVRRIADVQPGFRFVTAVHPSAQLARSVSIAAGSVVMAGAVLNPGVRLGTSCIVNTNASVDHDSTLEDYSSLAPNCSTGGNVAIGAYSAVLIGANISNAVRIGEHCVIGAGATVLDDLPDCQLAVGTPARAIRVRAPGDPYLG